MQGWGGSGESGKETNTPNPNRNREEAPSVEVLALFAAFNKLGGLSAQSSLRLHEATTRLPPAGSTAEASENAVLRRLGVLQAGCRVCPLLPTWQEMEPSPWAAWRRTSAKNITDPFSSPNGMVSSKA